MAFDACDTSGTSQAVVGKVGKVGQQLHGAGRLFGWPSIWSFKEAARNMVTLALRLDGAS